MSRHHYPHFTDDNIEAQEPGRRPSPITRWPYVLRTSFSYFEDSCRCIAFVTAFSDTENLLLPHTLTWRRLLGDAYWHSRDQLHPGEGDASSCHGKVAALGPGTGCLRSLWPPFPQPVLQTQVCPFDWSPSRNSWFFFQKTLALVFHALYKVVACVVRCSLEQGLSHLYSSLGPSTVLGMQFPFDWNLIKAHGKLYLAILQNKAILYLCGTSNLQW